MNNFLNVKNLIKTFKGESIPSINLSFNLNAGEKLALTGADGSGKTTLLRLLSGLLLPDNICSFKNKISPVLIDNLSPYFNYHEIKKIIGYMPQKFGLYEDLTVIENLELYANLKNIKKEKQKELFDFILNFFGLFEFKDRLSGALSGGMKQKLGLSSILLSSPKILLLDEPTVGVDPISRRDLIEIVKKLSIENKITVIWATSYLDEIENFDKVLFIDNGEKLYFGNADEAIKSVSNFTFYIDENIEKRKILDNINKNFNIRDSKIEGDKIKVVFDSKDDINNFPYKLKPAISKFEDFVMKKLNRKKISLPFGIKNIELTAPNDIAIEAINLTKKYKNFIAANNINFQIKKGEIFGLLGPNGAGKSTTFKMLCSLIKPTCGTSKIYGHDILINPIETKKMFGYMAQKFSLFGNLTVRQNIDFFMGVYQVKRTFDEVIEGYNIEKYLNYDAQNLPLGYKQRLSLLCALVNRPPVLFLDEPTSGVDPVSRREFWARINNLARHKTTVVITTHFMDEAQFCDRVALVYQGKVLVVDTPDNLKNSIRSNKNQNPTMEDAFVEIVRRNK